MNTEKGFVKSKTMAVVIAVLAVIVLAAVLVFALKGCRAEDAPVQGGTTVPSSGNSDVVAEEEPEQEQEETSSASDPEVQTYTVTFKDYDGTVLKTEEVEEGKAATAPEVPKRKDFTFAGWDKPFDKVTADLTVTAAYTTDRTVIYAESVSVNKGAGQVSVNIRILNNPGILGAALKISVDDKVFGFAECAKTGYPYMTLTASGPAVDSSPYTFLLDAMELSNADKKDGTLFTVTFNIKDTAAAGSFAVKLACDKGDVVTEDYADAKAVLQDGVITIG